MSMSKTSKQTTKCQQLHVFIYFTIKRGFKFLSARVQHCYSKLKTVEKESDDRKQPFLDVQLWNEDEGTISTSVYRQKMHTDQC